MGWLRHLKHADTSQGVHDLGMDQTDKFAKKCAHGSQTANYVVRAEDLPRAVPGRTIVYCLKTVARRASPAHTLQSYQSGMEDVCS